MEIGREGTPMALDVEIPEPPDLDRPVDPDIGGYESVDPEEDPVGDDYRRQELAGLLDAGAWADAFEEWRASTYLTTDEYRAVVDLELIDEIDLYWNPADDDVGYRVPDVPSDRPSPYDTSLDPDDRQTIEAELDSLARIVTEHLERDYLRREEEEFGFFSEEG